MNLPFEEMMHSEGKKYTDNIQTESTIRDVGSACGHLGCHMALSTYRLTLQLSVEHGGKERAGGMTQVAERAGCFCRGPKIDSPHPRGSSEPFEIPLAKDLTPSSGHLRQQAQTHI